MQMWNADYEHEEQWKEYDAARPAMEVKRDVAGLAEEMFQSDEVVGEKRRRVSGVDGKDVEAQELEEGEIDEGDYLGETDEGNKRHDESLRKLREQNKALRTANDAMRVLATALNKEEREQDVQASPPTPSSARSNKSSSSEDSRGDSDIAMCDFDLDDLDDDDDVEDDHGDDHNRDEDEDDESGAEVPIHISLWLDKVDSGSER